MAGLAFVVELFAQSCGDLFANFRGVDHRLHAPVQREEPFELAQIGLDRRLHVRILELAGERRAIVGRSPVHLAERGRGRRMVLEAGKLLLPVGAELGRHAPLNEGPSHRRRFALQLGQLGRVFGRQRIRNGRQQLGNLHNRAFESAQRERQLGSIASPIKRKAEHATGRDPGRHAADIGADAGVARRARGETISFLVGQAKPRSMLDSPALWSANG